MARYETEPPVTLSVIDRLIDPQPQRHVEAPMTRAQSLREIKAAVRRDLEWLLNTRRTIEECPDSLKELQHSLYSYGLPDISSLYLRSSTDQDLLLKEITNTLRVFEPRLAWVKVRLDPPTEERWNIRFAIEGLLLIDPAPEPVLFDTVLEPSSGEYQVKGE
jgi:type VI secretion system protein ImpF